MTHCNRRSEADNRRRESGVDIVLLGYGTLALGLLRGLLETENCRVTGVFRWSSISNYTAVSEGDDRELARLVQHHGIQDLRFDSANSPQFTSRLERQPPDCVLVGAWSEILEPRTLGLPGVRFVNCHPSLLPTHRGTNPYASVIRNGDNHTGVTFHLMDQNLDGGPVLLQRPVPVRDDDTGGRLRERCAIQARAMVPELVSLLRGQSDLPVRNQDTMGQASYFPRLQSHDGLIRWNRGAREIHDQIRGLQPWLHAYTFVDGPLGSILVMPERSIVRTASAPGTAPGTLVSSQADTFWAITGDAEQQIGLQELRVCPFSWPLPRWLSRLSDRLLFHQGKVLHANGKF